MPLQILKMRFGGRALHHPRSSGSKARPVVPYYRVPTNGLLWVSVTALRLPRRILPHGRCESTRGSRCARSTRWSARGPAVSGGPKARFPDPRRTIVTLVLAVSCRSLCLFSQVLLLQRSDMLGKSRHNTRQAREMLGSRFLLPCYLLAECVGYSD